MAPPNLRAAAAQANNEGPEAVTSLPTGETIDDFEPLSFCEVDPKGHLFVEHDGLKSLIERIFGVVKDQNDKQNQVGEDIYDVRSNLTAVERQCVHLNVQIKDLQEMIQRAQMQINMMGAVAVQAQKQDTGPAETGILAAQDQALSATEALEDLTERFDNFERLTGGQLELYQSRFLKLEEGLARHEHTIDYDLGSRFDRNDEAMENIREDIDALRKRAVDESAKKADRSDVLKLTEWLMRNEETQKSTNDDILKAKEDFKHLNAMANEMVDTRHQCQELWRLVREESREVRDWISHSLDDLRKEVRSKAVATEVCDRMEALQKDVTGLAGRMQAVAHIKAQLNTKAEKNDVRRLQETSEFVQNELVNHGAVAAGTTCLACKRPMDKGDRFASGGREDTYISEEHQGRRLLGEVRNALDKGQGDLLEYVAVNVGSPVRTAGTDGRMYEGRVSPSPGPGDVPGEMKRPQTPGDLQLFQVRRPVSAAGSFASGPSRPQSRCASPNLTAGKKGPKEINAPLYLRPTSRAADRAADRAATPDPSKVSDKQPKTVRDVLGKSGLKETGRRSNETESQPESPIPGPTPGASTTTKDPSESIKISLPQALSP